MNYDTPSSFINTSSDVITEENSAAYIARQSFANNNVEQLWVIVTGVFVRL